MGIGVANIFDLVRDGYPTIMAPLSGITDAACRELGRRQGCGFVYAEMTSSEALVRDSEKAHGRIRGLDAPMPTVAQLLGNDPAIMADAAEMCVEMGADAVDINLGCPAKRVVRGGGGSALMREPKLVTRLIQAMKDRIKKPVSVKMRAGWNDQCHNAVDIARMAEDAGASAVAVHPRTRSQAFKGSAKWELIGQVKAAISVPVFGNGDVHNRADADRMLQETGCDGVMVGRAALGRPWIFRMMDDPAFGDPDFETRIGVALEHVHLLAKEKGERGVVEFRKHLACYLKTMPENKYVREKMGRMNQLSDVVEVLQAYQERLRRRRDMADK